jgi:AraC-like DNA-binding protein
MRQAKRLLENTDLKIAAIAEALGFSTENYFYRYFKDNTGISPNQYRQENR